MSGLYPVFRAFMITAFAYLAVACLVVALVQPDPVPALVGAVVNASIILEDFLGYLPWIAAGIIVLLCVQGRAQLAERMLVTLMALLGAMAMSSGFSLLKTMIPSLVPFYADVAFAEWDRILHGGTDPWVWTHQFAAIATPERVGILYFVIWSVPACFLPVILAVTDSDPRRIARFLILFVFVTLGLGNLIALFGSSVGPVYYDRLLGTTRFAPLLDMLQVSGISGSGIGALQDRLWDMYASGQTPIGSGISAFPSVHVASATVIALYLVERHRWFAPLAALFLAAILFCSVYIGWHYALDGYFSILAVLLCWGLLKRYQGRGAEPVPATVAPAT